MSAGRSRVRDNHVSREPRASRYYLESSALLAALLEDDAELMSLITPATTALSVLTLAEGRRGLHRALHAGRIGEDKAAEGMAVVAQIEADCLVLDISDTVLARVGRRFPREPVRTLDAIHLASAELLDDPTAPITLLTRDHRVRENAALLGLQVA